MKITGKQIMKLLGEKNQTKFIRTVFDPLKLSEDSDVFASWRVLDKERSQLMSGKKANSHSTFVTWAEKIKNSLTYSQLLEKIAAYQSDNEEQRKAFLALFESDKTDRYMPHKLAEKIERKFTRREDCEAVLLLFLWSIYREDISLLSFLYADEEKPVEQTKTVPDEITLRPHIISANPVYIGHDRLLELIGEKLAAGSHFVFLQGMGGVGKTESAKQYAKRFADRYDTVVFAECNSSLMNLLNDNTVFTLTKPFQSERFRNLEGFTETDEEYYQRKLTALRCAANERTLIILDNVDAQDALLSDFLTGFCHVIVTTRWQAQEVYPVETVQLDEINSPQEAREIFSAYYGRSVQDDPFAEKLIDYFSGHTLALELTAKQMKVSELSAKEMWEIISSQNEAGLEEGFLLPNKSRSVRSMASHVQQIFNLSNLSETECFILSCLSLMPKSGLAKKYARDFCGRKSFTELNSLIQRSWLRELDGVITMHTLIKETVQLACKPTLQSCKPFIDRMNGTLTAVYCYYAEYNKKTEIYMLASHLYDCFPQPDMEMCSFYEWAELIFSHYNQPVKALELAQRLDLLYRDELGETAFKTARMLCRIGCDERSCNHLEYALELLEKGREQLRQLPDKTSQERMYLSDVDLILADLYLHKYRQIKDEALLKQAEETSNELIRIRMELRPLYDPKEKSCVCSYRDLASIAIYRNHFEEAEQYLRMAEAEYRKSQNGLYLYYLGCGRADLETARGNDRDAVAFLEEALECRKRYFGSGVSGDTTAHVIEMQIRLGKLYDKIGDTEKAAARYREVQEALRPLPFYQAEYDQVSVLLAEMERRQDG